MIDPSTADVTARVVECLGRYGWPSTHPVIQRAVKFLLKDQTEEGPWFGRWGVNYVYGTSGVLRALETVALTARDYCQRAVGWLRAVQNSDGGFGESIASYYDPALKGKGASTASQTAWGLIGLLAATEAEDPAIGSRRESPGGAAAVRWFLGRKGIYGHRISVRVLSEISFVPELFSVVRAGAIPEHDDQDYAVLRAARSPAGI